MIQRFRCSISCSIAHTERSRIDLQLYRGFSQKRLLTRNEERKQTHIVEICKESGEAVYESPV